jgi:hypothetical protein
MLKLIRNEGKDYVFILSIVGDKLHEGSLVITEGIWKEALSDPAFIKRMEAGSLYAEFVKPDLSQFTSLEEAFSRTIRIDLDKVIASITNVHLSVTPINGVPTQVVVGTIKPCGTLGDELIKAINECDPNTIHFGLRLFTTHPHNGVINDGKLKIVTWDFLFDMVKTKGT